MLINLHARLACRRIYLQLYRSPTWAVLRALQQINSATRIEGETTMSAPLFFQSAGPLLREEKRTDGGDMREPIRS